MTEKAPINSEAGHQHFSATCFNQAWELIEKSERSQADDEQMLHLAHASVWHWTQRSDCTPKNLSIGYWQLARIYTLLGEAENARKYAQLCLDHTPQDDAFCLGYAYEALARAAYLAKQEGKAREYLAAARQQAELVVGEDRQLLLNDLKNLE